MGIFDFFRGNKNKDKIDEASISNNDIIDNTREDIIEEEDFFITDEMLKSFFPLLKGVDFSNVYPLPKGVHNLNHETEGVFKYLDNHPNNHWFFFSDNKNNYLIKKNNKTRANALLIEINNGKGALNEENFNYDSRYSNKRYKCRGFLIDLFLKKTIIVKKIKT